MRHLEHLNSFTIDTLPNLDEVVLGALERFSTEPPPSWPEIPFLRPLVLASGNSYHTARLLMPSVAVADESGYETALAAADYDGVVIVSASGEKHALLMAEAAERRHLPVRLVTHNPATPLKDKLPEDRVIVFPKNREPYTYNVSTYLGLILARTGESTSEILSQLETINNQLGDAALDRFEAYTFSIPTDWAGLASMARTKFDELFGGRVLGRVFTVEEIKHAKTVVPYDQELFISFGVANDYFGLPENRLALSVDSAAGLAAAFSLLYFTVGQIQAGKPPYFKDNLVSYCAEASEIFGHPISPIVE